MKEKESSMLTWAEAVWHGAKRQNKNEQSCGCRANAGAVLVQTSLGTHRCPGSSGPSPFRLPFLLSPPLTEQQTREQSTDGSQTLGQTSAHPSSTVACPSPPSRYHDDPMTVFKLVLSPAHQEHICILVSHFLSLSFILWVRFLLTHIICITALPVSRETAVLSV